MFVLFALHIAVCGDWWNVYMKLFQESRTLKVFWYFSSFLVLWILKIQEKLQTFYDFFLATKSIIMRSLFSSCAFCDIAKSWQKASRFLWFTFLFWLKSGNIFHFFYCSISKVLCCEDKCSERNDSIRHKRSTHFRIPIFFNVIPISSLQFTLGENSGMKFALKRDS